MAECLEEYEKGPAVAGPSVSCQMLVQRGVIEQFIPASQLRVVAAHAVADADAVPVIGYRLGKQGDHIASAAAFVIDGEGHSALRTEQCHHFALVKMYPQGNA